MLILPEVPDAERASIQLRIVRKWQAFEAEGLAGNMDPNREQGELYEIASAILLYYQRLVVSGNHLSRWRLPGEANVQHISMGANEYDFVVDGPDGVLLGDAKSQSSGLGEYIKKAVSFCLLDRFVNGGQNRLAGFCFITPSPAEPLLRSAAANAIGILSGWQEASGITGLNSQLIPADVRLYFQRYTPEKRAPQPKELTGPVEQYLAELRSKAGLDIRFLSNPFVPRDVLKVNVEKTANWFWPDPKP